MLLILIKNRNISNLNKHLITISNTSLHNNVYFIRMSIFNQLIENDRFNTALLANLSQYRLFVLLDPSG